MRKRWLSFVLLLGLLVQLAVPVLATDGGADVLDVEQMELTSEDSLDSTVAESDGDISDIERLLSKPVVHNNPLCPELVDDNTEDLLAGIADEAKPPLGTGAPQSVESSELGITFVSEEQAVRQARDQMVARKNELVIYVHISGGLTATWIGDFLSKPYKQDYAEGYYDGDYLKWHYRRIVYLGEGYYAYYGNNNFEFHFLAYYYTTAAQEQQVQTMLRQVYNGLSLSGLTDFGKYAAIYDYVTDHVAYDYLGLATEIQIESPLISQLGEENFRIYINNNWSYYRPYYEIHTAYAALIRGKAVCQGFATLYYALCRMAGLQVRMVASAEHGWNIIKLGNYWYGADTTFDDDYKSGQWKSWRYFAKGSNTFSSGHIPTSEYTTTAFKSKYPMAATDYTKPANFWDLTDGKWYVSAVNSAYSSGLMSGTSTNPPKFDPNSTTTRGMIVTILYRMAGEPYVSSTYSYADVAQGKYYTKAVAWAKANNIVSGVGDNKFNPSGLVTRQDAMVMIYNYYTKYLRRYASNSRALYSFPDVNKMSSYSTAALEWAYGNGIISGTATDSGTMLDPKGYTTRAQFASMIVRYVDKYGKR